MDVQVNSLTRIVQLYRHLLQKGYVDADESALRYGKHKETIKKDIRYILDVLDPDDPQI